jgi:hypothetical protein
MLLISTIVSCILVFSLCAMEELQQVVADDLRHRAVIKGDEQKVAELIKAGMDGTTQLYVAVSAGQARAVVTLAEHGAVTHEKYLSCTGPLLYVAAENGHEEVVKILLEKGAEIDCVYDGSTPLHRAAVNAQWGVLKLLISMGADRNRRIGQDKAYYEVIKYGQRYIIDKNYAMVLEQKTAYELALYNKNDGYYFMALGDLYYMGQNKIAADLTIARYNYERAAAQNNNPEVKVEALVKLGAMYQ